MKRDSNDRKNCGGENETMVEIEPMEGDVDSLLECLRSLERRYYGFPIRKENDNE